jgi:hypothetical protein
MAPAIAGAWLIYEFTGIDGRSESIVTNLGEAGV